MRVLPSLGLFVVGAAVSLASGREVWWGGLRMLLLGCAAAGVTFGLGTLIGQEVLD